MSVFGIFGIPNTDVGICIVFQISDSDLCSVFRLLCVVLSETVNTFKSRLDKFWQHQDMIYDFQAELHGTGSRSLHYN